jgi:hypothetical protein
MGTVTARPSTVVVAWTRLSPRLPRRGAGRPAPSAMSEREATVAASTRRAEVARATDGIPEVVCADIAARFDWTCDVSEIDSGCRGVRRFSITPRQRGARVIHRVERVRLIARPALPLPVTIPPSRAREHRVTRRARARSPGTADDPDPEPSASARLCGCGCGEPVPARKRGYVDDAHSNRARQRRHKRQHRADIYSAEIDAARRRDLLDGVEALELHVFPSRRAEAALAVRELVARVFADFDHGRVEIARRAAAPLAREIFDELEAEAGRSRR